MGKYKGFGGSGMNQNKKVPNVVKQAQMMQEKMEAVQQEVEKKEVTATSGGGVVSVTMNGKKQITAIKIKPEAVDPDDVETLEDLVTVAVNDAIKQAEALMESAMGEITGNISLPGLF
ncbi:MAG: YbaB/EbfC family nucleoid-associated protein [Clostridia bacterium]|nr:YbaB/EbfC family nucleoid-associated protein [Clostridia bacterium]